MDCARSARRLGGRDVTVVARSPFAEMKAAPWEKDGVRREGIAIHDNLVPEEFIVDGGRLTAVMFEPVGAVYENRRRRLVPTGAPLQPFPCDDAIVAIGQEPSFPWIERDLGLAFDARGLPEIDPKTFQSTHPKVFYGGEAAFGPKNIITAVAHGHEAAISIARFLSGAIPDRMAQLLRLLPDPDRAHQSRSVDPPKTAHVSLAAVAERTQSLQGAAPQRRSQVPRCGRCRFTDRALPYVRASGGANGTAQPRLRRSRSASTLCCALKLNPIEPPVYGPVCTVVLEGRRREASPYPDLCIAGSGVGQPRAGRRSE